MTRIQHRRGTAAGWAAANPVLASGEPGFETDTGIEKIGNGVSAWSALAVRFGLDPETFPGTDHQKVQAALNYSIANGFPALVFRRQFNITGAGPLSIDKTGYADRRVISMIGESGGITKTDAGAMFTSSIANMGDIDARGMRFYSTAGVGTIVWDCEKLIRISSKGCEYWKIDYLAYVAPGSRYIQSVKFIDDHIVAGNGHAVVSPVTIDLTFAHCLVEDRTGGLLSNGADVAIIQNNMLRIQDNVIENCLGTTGGPPVILGSCWASDISGNYFEANFTTTTLPDLDLHTLCGTLGHYGLALRNNHFTRGTAQKAANASAVHVGRTNSAGITSASNICDGILYEFKSGSGSTVPLGSIVALGGDYSGTDSRVILRKYHAGAYASPAINWAPNSGTTAARPAAPRLREMYYDTTLGKPIWCSAVGTLLSQGFEITGGASASGNITVTPYLTTPFVVAVTAGDSAVAVRDKIVAPVVLGWRLVADFTSHVSMVREIPQAATLPTVDVAATGVTFTGPSTDVAHVAATWVDSTGALADGPGPVVATEVSDALTVGESTIPRTDVNSALVSMATGILRLSYFTAQKTETVNSLRLVGGTTAAAATPTLVRAGVYTVAGNGDLTLVASIANDTSLFATANTAYTVALSAPWAKVRGTRYAFGLIVVTAGTAPSVSGNVTTGGITAESAMAPKLAGTFGGQTDLPSTVASASAGATLSRIYGVMIP